MKARLFFSGVVFLFLFVSLSRGDFSNFVWSKTGENGNWTSALNWDGPAGQYPDDPDERAVFHNPSGMGMPIQTATMSNGLGQLVFNYSGWTIYTDYKPLRLDPYSAEGSYNAIFSYAQGGAGVNLIYPEVELLRAGLNIHTGSDSTLVFGWSYGGGFIGSYAPVISSVNPTSEDTGAVRLDGASTVSSPFYLRQGTLLVRYSGPGGDALGSSTGTVFIGGDEWVTDGGWARLLTDADGASVTKNLRVRSYSGHNVQAVLGGQHTSGSSTFSGTVTLDLDASLTAAGSSTVSFTNTISGAGGITKTGIGTVQLHGSNTYQGATTVQSGILELVGDHRLPVNTTVTVAPGATLALSGTSGQTLASLNGGGSVTAGGGHLSVGSGLFEGSISGSCSFEKIGSGALTLSGANSYIGPTFVSGGTLRLGRDHSLPTGTSLTLANTAGVILDLAGHDQAISSLNGGGSAGGTVALGGGELTVLDGSFAGSITGSGSVKKDGGGVLVLSGQNNYTGGTRVEGGSLLVNGYHLGGGVFRVSEGALLGGLGRLDANISVDPGGILAPGLFSTGSLTVGGNVFLKGILQIQLESGIMPGDCTRLLTEGLLAIPQATLDLQWSGTLSENAYVFAEYGQLDGDAFGHIVKLPDGYRIDYDFQGQHQIALVLIPEPATLLLLGVGILFVRRGGRKVR